MPDWSRGVRDKLRVPLLADRGLFLLTGVWERALFESSSPCKKNQKLNIVTEKKKKKKKIKAFSQFHAPLQCLPFVHLR